MYRSQKLTIKIDYVSYFCMCGVTYLLCCSTSCEVSDSPHCFLLSLELTLRERERERERKKRGKGWRVCVCVCVRERERE